MHIVSDEFKKASRALGRQKDTVIYWKNEESGGESVFHPESVEYSFSGRMFQTCMAYIKADFKDANAAELFEKTVGFKNGFFTGEDFEYIDYGEFFVKDMENNVEKGTVRLTCYDRMIDFMKQYQKLELTYPCTLLELIKEICRVCSVELYHEDIFSGGLEIPMDYYDGLNVTYRDVLDQIAQVTASTIFIKDGKVYFSGINETGEAMGTDTLRSIKMGEHLKPVSSLVLSREPQEDNIYAQDAGLIETSGLSELRFANNEIIDKRRDQVIKALFEKIKGTEYYTFEAEETGLCCFEPCDRVRLEDTFGNIYDVVILDINLKLTSGVKEIISAQVSQSTTQYKYATTSEKRLKNTEIIVDKQKNEIKSIVEDTEDNFTKIYQALENINYDVQTAGGVNLVRNSVMFLDDGNKPTHWELDGNQIRIQSSPEGINRGCISGNEFLLTDTFVKQVIPNLKVDSSDVPEEEKLYYSFGVRVKKPIGSRVTIKIFGGDPNAEGESVYHEYIITIGEEKECDYELFEISGILPRYDSYTLQLGCQGQAAFTDIMLCQGKSAKTWTQANGEYMNTNITIDTDGIKVKSNLYQGDYTIMSPLEFAGYSKASGTLEKTFYLQRDETHTKKICASDSAAIGSNTMLPVELAGIDGIVFI